MWSHQHPPRLFAQNSRVNSIVPWGDTPSCRKNHTCFCAKYSYKNIFSGLEARIVVGCWLVFFVSGYAVLPHGWFLWAVKIHTVFCRNQLSDVTRSDASLRDHPPEKRELENYTVWKISMEPIQITQLERKMTFQTCMIMLYVNLPGCLPFELRASFGGVKLLPFKGWMHLVQLNSQKMRPFPRLINSCNGWFI